MSARLGFAFLATVVLFVVTLQAVDGIDKTVWDGVYTTAQAERGKFSFQYSCSECHLNDLTGRSGPPLKGDPFTERWRGDTVDRLFNKIRTTMPADSSSRLRDATYVDILAYLLQANGFPAGSEELEAEALDTIRLDVKTDR